MKAKAAIFGLRESTFSDIANKWVKLGASPEMAKAAMGYFKTYKASGLIRGPEADISRWASKPFEDFQAFLNGVKQQDVSKQAAKSAANDVEIVSDTSQALVVVPHTWEAAKKYGTGTKWCISHSQVKDQWDFHTGYDKIKFYFVIAKNLPKTDPLHKVAVLVNTKFGDGDQFNDGFKEAFDAEDNYISDTESYDTIYTDDDLDNHLASLGLGDINWNAKTTSR